MKDFKEILSHSNIERLKKLLSTFINTNDDAIRELIASRWEFKQAENDDEEIKVANALAYELFTHYRTNSFTFDKIVFLQQNSFSLTSTARNLFSEIENSDVLDFKTVLSYFNLDKQKIASTELYLKYNYKSCTYEIDDIYFTEYIAQDYCYYNSRFYDLNGLVENNVVKNHIYQLAKSFVRKNLDTYVEHIFETLKFECMCKLDIDLDKIHFANGTLIKDSKSQFTDFTTRKEFCLNRINASYYPDSRPPRNFLRYLSDLLPLDSIRTVQQFLGVCLLPTTKLQTALSLIGDGGEGKSVLGAVLSEVFGTQNVIYEHIVNLDTNRFAVANLESKLVCIDDDVSEHALTNSNVFKTIVTATTQMQVERKFEQYNNIQIYARFLCFGNFALSALYDNTDAFKRRLINIRVNKKNKDRQDDANLIEKLRKEKNQILKWLIDGLNDYLQTNVLYIADSIKKQSDELALESDTVELWLRQSNNLVFSPDQQCHTQILYKDYVLFCEQECVVSCQARSFALRLKSKADKYNLIASHNIVMNLQGFTTKHRGFRGIGIKFR